MKNMTGSRESPVSVIEMCVVVSKRAPWENQKTVPPYGKCMYFPHAQKYETTSFGRSSIGVSVGRPCIGSLLLLLLDALRAVMAPMGNMASPKGAFLCESGRLRSNAG